MTSINYFVKKHNCSLFKMSVVFSGLLSVVDLGSSQDSHTGNHHHGQAPIWRIEPPRHAVFSNSSGARLECVALGEPPPTIEWYQTDSRLITRNLHGLRLVMANGTLIFPPFK